MFAGSKLYFNLPDDFPDNFRDILWHWFSLIFGYFTINISAEGKNKPS
jgi:hypothetical protein